MQSSDLHQQQEGAAPPSPSPPTAEPRGSVSPSTPARVTASRRGPRPPRSYLRPAGFHLSSPLFVLHGVCGAGGDGVERKDLLRQDGQSSAATCDTLGAHGQLVPGVTGPAVTAAIFVST